MKNKIRDGIMYFGVISSVILVLLISVNLFNYNTIVEFPSLDSFKKQIAIYKEKVKALEDGQCRENINKLISKIESTNYEGKVDFKKIYNSNNSILSYYTIIRDACNFDTETLNDNSFSTMYMSSIIPYEYINREYIFGYELKFKDTVEDELKVNLFNTSTIIKRNNELNIIGKYIELAKEVQNEK